MKLIAYIRVSSQSKADHEDSAGEQERKLRAWAKRNRHTIVDVMADEGVTGHNGDEGIEANGLADRVALPVALADLAAGKAAGIVVTKLDRLARDLILQEQLLAEIHRQGGEPFTVSPSEQAFLGDDPADPSRKLIRRVLGAVSEYERDMVVLRLRGGKLRKRSAGGYIGGYVPFGYRPGGKGHDAEPVPAEAAAVNRILALRAEGKSYREIIATLEAEGIRPRSAERWSPSTVRGICLREQVPS